jgi:hypothetical protein
MKTIPLRWVLPTFHLAMDLILVAIFIAALGWLLNHPLQSGFFRPISYEQSVTMMIDPRAPGLMKPFSLLITGALPAGIISLFALSFTSHDINLPYDSRAFLWFGLYECLAVPLWLFVSRVPTAYWWGIASMFVRVMACLIGFSSFWGAGPGLQAAFWVIAMIYIITAGLWWLTMRVRSGRRGAA